MSSTCLPSKSHVIVGSIEAIFNLQNFVVSNVLPCLDVIEASKFYLLTRSSNPDVNQIIYE